MSSSIPPFVLGLIVALLVAVAYLWIIVLKVKRRLKVFMAGNNGASLEAALSALTHKTSNIEETLKAHKEGLEYIDARVKRSIRGYSLVRYDAYDDAGGEQSFASGLLDEYGDGFILSCIVNRNHVGVYTKKIAAGVPEATLTHEESQALTLAKKSINL